MVSLLLSVPIAEELIGVTACHKVLVLFLELGGPRSGFPVFTELIREAAVVQFEHASRSVVEDGRLDEADDHAARECSRNSLDDHGFDRSTAVRSVEDNLIAGNERTAEYTVSWIVCSVEVKERLQRRHRLIWVVIVGLLFCDRALSYGRRSRFSRLRVESRIHMSDVVYCSDRNSDVEVVTGLSSFAINVVDGVHADLGGCRRAKVEVARVTRVTIQFPGFFARVKPQENLDWTAETDNSEAVAQSGRRRSLERGKFSRVDVHVCVRCWRWLSRKCSTSHVALKSVVYGGGVVVKARTTSKPRGKGQFLVGSALTVFSLDNEFSVGTWKIMET
jgi:hypothetical protein